MSTAKTKMLILSGDLGDGHQQAANALRETAQLRDPNIDVTVVNFMELTHPYLHTFSRYLFVQGVKKFPSIYGYLYQKTRHTHSPSSMLKTINLFSMGRLMKLLEELQPTVVTSTFPLAAYAMSLLKGKGLTVVPTVTVITDHTDHSYWVQPYTNQYIVGSEQVRFGLNRMGILDSHIAVTGIPVRPSFNQTYERKSLGIKHQLDPSQPTVLIMGGGCGIIDIGISDLLTTPLLSKQLQFIIVCGRNEKLRQQLSDEAKRSKHRVVVTGFVDTINEFMALSDLIITKPGGLTTSEALTMGIPMLLYKPLAGQEQDNAAFLLAAGAAVQAENEEDLLTKCSELLHQPKLLRNMKQSTKRIRTRDSAFQAMDVILQTQSKSVSARRLQLSHA
jgi:processive 1,2-diacylglycerol beta-glucosyltransferase